MLSNLIRKLQTKIGVKSQEYSVQVLKKRVKVNLSEVGPLVSKGRAVINGMAAGVGGVVATAKRLSGCCCPKTSLHVCAMAKKPKQWARSALF